MYKRLKQINSFNVVIGISGGLDSTLALLFCYSTFKRFNIDTKHIHTLTMPGKATSVRTKTNALSMMDLLNTSSKNIDINNHVDEHFKLIEHDGVTEDITYENTQARIRTMVLMNYANKVNGIVIGTGDLSEIALGWATYNGDNMSMYSLNGNIPKTLVIELIKNYCDYYIKDNKLKVTLLDVIDTPISPELTNNQQTEDKIGKYDINDFILYKYLFEGYSEESLMIDLEASFDISTKEAEDYVKKFFNRFYTQQFKRQIMPDGPKVLKTTLNPRFDHKLPSDLNRYKK